MKADLGCPLETVAAPATPGSLGGGRERAKQEGSVLKENAE